MDKNFESLQKALRNLEKPSLNKGIKDEMKKHILMQIQNKQYIPSSLERLRIAIKQLAVSLKPSPAMRVRIREAILERDNRVFGWDVFLNWQRGLAASVVAVIVFLTVTMYVGEIPVTNAAQQTAFQKVMGTVEIVRGGEQMKAEKGMILKEGDIIVTGVDGIAVIQYVDDSITRLSPETELKIHKLYQDVQNEEKTEIEIELTQGRVWSQIVNGIEEEASFQITADAITASVNETASFDIQHEAEEENVKVSVFDNNVEVSFQDNIEEKKQVVMEGYAVEIDQNEPAPELEMVALTVGDKENELWINTNTAEDKEYIAEINVSIDDVEEVLTVERIEEVVVDEPKVEVARVAAVKVVAGEELAASIEEIEETEKSDVDVAAIKGIDGEGDVPVIMPVEQEEQESDQTSPRFLQ